MTTDDAAQAESSSERVLIVASSRRDAALTEELLAANGFAGVVCDGLRDLVCKLEAGAGAALIAEESLGGAGLTSLAEAIARQPAWSDFPVVIFSAVQTGRARESRDVVRLLGNVMFLDRPVQVRTMLAAIEGAVRGRRRQYAARGAIESRDQFLAMLGHELRNPLAAIRLALARSVQSSDPAVRTKQHALIERQSRQLARLVDDLLDVARVTYGKVVVHSERVDLDDVARSCCVAQEANALAYAVTLVVDAPPRPIWVAGDRLRLEQVVSNLLTNALKYTPRGGTVTVSTTADAAHNRGEVCVRDTGIGLAREMLDHVFDLFAQADRTLDRAQGGLGLGLTVVRSLVQLHGGEVRAASEGLGRGSEFTVSIPLASETPAVVAATVPTTTPEPCARRVVLVEDNDDIRATLEDLLRFAGHSVSSAADGPSGVHAILRERPHIAFVDIGLPGFDGFEVARRVRAAKGPQVRLVAVSGYGQSEDRRRALEAGFDGHLTKPVDIDQLEATMARAP